jgi:two-component system response regulator AlgR
VNILVVDDEPLARMRLQDLLARAPFENLSVAEADSGEAALAWLAQHPVDLVLLDIQMPGMDGLALARILSERPDAPAIIFCTAHEAHALEAFDLRAVHYLLKPYRAEKLYAAIGGLAGRRPVTAPLVLHDGGKTLRILPQDILYLAADHKYVRVVHRGGEVLTEESLNHLEEKLDGFVRCHRAYLVSLAAIDALQKKADGQYCLALRDHETQVPVSRRQLSCVRKLLSRPS